MNIFTLTTSYTFEFTLIAMLAASAYFILERYKLSNEYKSISTLAFLTTFLAVIEYYNMREFFSLSNLNNPNINYPTEYRYITWFIATPIMLYTFFVISKIYKTNKIIVSIALSLNFLMIVSGYFSESSFSNSTMPLYFSYMMFTIGFVSWLGILYIFNFILPKVIQASNVNGMVHIQNCLSIVNKFIVYGWAIYPLGLAISFYDSSVETALTREIIYNFGDLFNKVGFSLTCFLCAARLSRNT